MPSLDPAAVSWLRAHHSTISLDALADIGVSRARRQRLVASGVLERVLHGGYAFAGAEVDEPARCAAVCSSRPHLTIAGPTAARLWALRRAPRDGLVHVIAPPRSNPCRQPWIRPYRTAALYDDEWIERIDGIRVTTPARTVVDLTRYVEPSALGSVIEQVLANGTCAPDSLLRIAERLDGPGRPWVRRFLAVLGRRVPGGAAESHGEFRLVDDLATRGITDLRRQVEVELTGFGRVRFDAAIPAIRWAVEVDLHFAHREDDGRLRDRRRDVAAKTDGWLVERVDELDVRTRGTGVVDELVTSIERRRRDVDALRHAGRWPAR